MKRLSSISRARRRNSKSSKLLRGRRWRWFPGGLAQQQGLALEAGVAFALGVDHVGQVVEAGIDLGCAQVHRWIGAEVAKVQGAVVDPHFIQGDGQQLAQLRPPVGAGTGLRSLAVAAIDEVHLGLDELHPRHHRMVVPQRMPAHCQVDQRRLDERHRHLAADLDDLQAVDAVGAAPQGQVDIADPATVVAHVRELVVQVVTYQVGQGDVQADQQYDQARQGPQGPTIATFHGWQPPVL